MNRFLPIFLFFIFLKSNILVGQSLANIIPKPQILQKTEGNFRVSAITKIVASDNLKGKAKLLKTFIEPALGFDLAIISKAEKKNCIELKLDKTLNSLGEEGYKLDISPEKITLSASKEVGILWGIQTIRQLLPEQIFRNATIKNVSWDMPCLKIEDKPRFPWRGLMIDCSRTFVAKEQLKKYIEQLSLYKMNILHLHLTDDQGWRMEIKKYPELTSVCAKFDTSFHEPLEYQGFYSQDDMRELIEFAAQRNVQIIPEIEMPGHTTEVFAAFPQFSCKGDTLKIKSWTKGYGVRSEVFCAGNDETFHFLENILDEIITLFPSQYVHIGGDEAPKMHWKACPKCQKRIKDEGLKDEDELQSWFVRRIEKYINSKGKKLIGWDEIMEGGLSNSATVMYWRNWHKETAKKITTIPNNVIMSPTSYSYFDYLNEKISVEKVYTTNPILEGNSDKILGVQANFWSHLARTVPQIDRQLFPRLIALSEIAWTDNDKKDWTDFNKRLQLRTKTLDIMGIYYFSENK